VKIRTATSCALAAVLVASLAAADGPGLEMLEMGTGPTIVMVPGLGGSRTDWLQTVKRLRDRFHCVMVELPGQGKSPLPDPFTFQAAAEALDAVIAQQKAESTIVVGSGFGGTLGLLALAAHPDHVRGVMLLDAPIKSSIAIPDQQRAQFVKFMNDNYDTFSKMAFAKLGRDSAENALTYARMAAVAPLTVKAYVGHMLSEDATREFNASASRLALAYTEPRWPEGESPGSVMRKFGIEDTTAVVPRRIAGSGVFVMKDQPDTLAAHLADFAARSFVTKR
jgi:pimeloyl-ACP methyl ester carboxylesterase